MKRATPSAMKASSTHASRAAKPVAAGAAPLHSVVAASASTAARAKKAAAPASSLPAATPLRLTAMQQASATIRQTSRVIGHTYWAA